MRTTNSEEYQIQETFLQIYRRNENAIKLLIGLAVLIAIAGLAGVVHNVIFDKNGFTDPSLWNNIFFVLTGLLYIFLMKKSLQDKKYHIAWNEYEINYHLPKQKEPEHVSIKNIKFIDMSEHEVKMGLNNSQEKIINLNFFFLPTRNKVKDFFENLKTNIENRN